jgi:orotate phosphoribosyltransferase
MNHRERLGQILSKKSLIRGEITLSSGQKSDYYLDCRLTTLDPEGAFLTGHVVLEALEAMGVKADAIGGLSMGADPIVSAVVVISHLEKKPLRGFLVRKESKNHGRQKQIEGLEGAVHQVVIVDDVCTTGESTQIAIDAAESAGYKVVAVISLVDRGEGGSDRLRSKYDYRSIFSARELMAKSEAS